MTDNFNFDDLEPISFPVRYRGEEYVAREATEGAAKKWRNATIRGTRMEGGKVISMGDIADSEPLLVSLCLFKVTDKGEVPVPFNTICGWPARVVRPIHDKIKDISGLNEDDTEESLVKRIAEMEQKLQEIRRAKGADPTSQRPENTENISPSAES